MMCSLICLSLQITVLYHNGTIVQQTIINCKGELLQPCLMPLLTENLEQVPCSNRYTTINIIIKYTN